MKTKKTKTMKTKKKITEDDLFTKQEKKRASEFSKKMVHDLTTLLHDYMLSVQENRILIHHFGLTPRQFAEILMKYEGREMKKFRQSLSKRK